MLDAKPDNFEAEACNILIFRALQKALNWLFRMFSQSLWRMKLESVPIMNLYTYEGVPITKLYIYEGVPIMILCAYECMPIWKLYIVKLYIKSRGFCAIFQLFDVASIQVQLIFEGGLYAKS